MGYIKVTSVLQRGNWFNALILVCLWGHLSPVNSLECVSSECLTLGAGALSFWDNRAVRTVTHKLGASTCSETECSYTLQSETLDVPSSTGEVFDHVFEGSDVSTTPLIISIAVASAEEILAVDPPVYYYLPQVPVYELMAKCGTYGDYGHISINGSEVRVPFTYTHTQKYTSPLVRSTDSHSSMPPAYYGACQYHWGSLEFFGHAFIIPGIGTTYDIVATQSGGVTTYALSGDVLDHKYGTGQNCIASRASVTKHTASVYYAVRYRAYSSMIPKPCISRKGIMFGTSWLATDGTPCVPELEKGVYIGARCLKRDGANSPTCLTKDGFKQCDLPLCGDCSVGTTYVGDRLFGCLSDIRGFTTTGKDVVFRCRMGRNGTLAIVAENGWERYKSGGLACEGAVEVYLEFNGLVYGHFGGLPRGVVLMVRVNEEWRRFADSYLWFDALSLSYTCVDGAHPQLGSLHVFLHNLRTNVAMVGANMYEDVRVQPCPGVTHGIVDKAAAFHVNALDGGPVVLDFKSLFNVDIKTDFTMGPYPTPSWVGKWVQLSSTVQDVQAHLEGTSWPMPTINLVQSDIIGKGSGGFKASQDYIIWKGDPSWSNFGIYYGNPMEVIFNQVSKNIEILNAEDTGNPCLIATEKWELKQGKLNSASQYAYGGDQHKVVFKPSWFIYTLPSTRSIATMYVKGGTLSLTRVQHPTHVTYLNCTSNPRCCNCVLSTATFRCAYTNTGDAIMQQILVNSLPGSRCLMAGSGVCVVNSQSKVEREYTVDFGFTTVTVPGACYFVTAEEKEQLLVVEHEKQSANVSSIGVIVNQTSLFTQVSSFMQSMGLGADEADLLSVLSTTLVGTVLIFIFVGVGCGIYQGLLKLSKRKGKIS